MSERSGPATSGPTVLQAAQPVGASAYRSGFARWYERASVRRSPRRLLLDGAQHRVYFPPELVPAVSHRLVVAQGPDAVRSILVDRLHQYLQFTVELEATAVVPVTSAIARRRSGLLLPDAMYADAFRISTDEAWHAQFSYDLIMQVAATTGIAPWFVEPPAFAGRLDEIRDQLDPALRRLPDLIFAVISETLISAILSDLPHDDRLPKAVRDAVADHAEDEGKHHAYFRTLLGFLWPALDAEQRRALGPWVPRLIWAFLEPDYRAMGHALAAVGLGPDEVEQVLHEAYPLAAVSRTIAGAAGSTVRYFREVGALDDARTRDAFCAAGLLDDG
jgi:P-aminobenzoate N-oxygenase AurF